jgi:hypothetical protein
MQRRREPEMNVNSSESWYFANRELSRRSSGGIEVVLLWSERTGQVTVCVSDQRGGAYFELHPPPELALDVFNHPYSYADRGQPRYEDERLAA